MKEDQYIFEKNNSEPDLTGVSLSEAVGLLNEFPDGTITVLRTILAPSGRILDLKISLTTGDITYLNQEEIKTVIDDEFGLLMPKEKKYLPDL